MSTHNMCVSGENRKKKHVWMLLLPGDIGHSTNDFA